MYLSSLQVDVTGHVGRRWSSNPYLVHKSVAKAFPQGSGRVLFRVEDQREPPRVIVQSEAQPDWSLAFTEGSPVIGVPQVKSVDFKLRDGQQLRFILRANPVKRIPTRKANSDKDNGPRVGLSNDDDQRAWLERKGEQSGFRPLDFAIQSSVNVGYAKESGGTRRTMTFRLVEYEGRLEVTEAGKLVEALAAGFGAAKGMGFGLMLVAGG